MIKKILYIFLILLFTTCKKDLGISVLEGEYYIEFLPGYVAYGTYYINGEFVKNDKYFSHDGTAFNEKKSTVKIYNVDSGYQICFTNFSLDSVAKVFKKKPWYPPYGSIKNSEDLDSINFGKNYYYSDYYYFYHGKGYNFEIMKIQGVFKGSNIHGNMMAVEGGPAGNMRLLKCPFILHRL